MDDLSTLPIAAGFGALAGLRTFSAPLALARASRVEALSLATTPLSLLANSKGAHTLGALALGELIADKTPAIPNRTDPPALIGRFISGALAGATVVKARKGSWILGAIVGGAAAVVSAYAGYELRHRASKASHIPDPLLAVLEDGLVIAGGLALIESLKR